MKTCPRCQQEMNDHVVDGVTVDGCDQCGGLWFDKGELRQMVRRSPRSVSALEEAVKPAEGAATEAPATCPACTGSLHPGAFRSAPGITVHACRECGGVWLDDGDLVRIHQQLRETTESQAKATRPPERARAAGDFLVHTACPQCGKRVPRGAKSCWSCKQPLTVSHSQASTATGHAGLAAMVMAIVLVVSFALFVGAGTVIFSAMSPGDENAGRLLTFAVWCCFAIVVCARCLCIVRPYQRALVETLGKFSRQLESGLHILVPGIERAVRVDMREMVVDVPPQEVITEDNVRVVVDAVLYLQVTDPVSVVYNVENVYEATVKLARTTVRNMIGDLELDQTLTSRDHINRGLREVLDHATDTWGIRVVRVEIQKIDPPRDIIQAMSQQMRAERERRAAILSAEGQKRAAVLKAEGEREAAVTSADGKAESISVLAGAVKDQRILRGEGKAQAVDAVFSAIHGGNPDPHLVQYRYLQTLAALADGEDSKLLMPLPTGIGRCLQAYLRPREGAD